MNITTPTSARRANFLAPAFAVCGALALFAGCASDESHVVSAPPPAPAATTMTTQTTQSAPVTTQGPTYTTTTPAGTSTSYTTTTTAAPTNTVIVTSAPPALQSEVVLARPNADYVWVPGYWTWRESRYQWMAGHWELPPYKGSSWIAPHTEMEGNAYRFYEGHWN
ncbi:MAG: YXWGXW repeat-containing protein [Opitutaceae bacterium]